MIHEDFSTPFGIGNRVAAIAAAMIRQPEVVFHWRNNIHLPAEWDEIFPNGIPGVTFVPEPLPIPFRLMGKNMGHQWGTDEDRSKSHTAFQVVLRCMTGEAAPHPPAVAILGRFHRSHGSCPHKLADAATAQAEKAGTHRVFILSDKFRTEISQRLSHAGIESVLPLCPPLPVDLVRSLPEIVDYLSDWKTLLRASCIVATPGPASALHPARAAGTPVILSEND